MGGWSGSTGPPINGLTGAAGGGGTAGMVVSAGGTTGRAGTAGTASAWVDDTQPIAYAERWASCFTGRFVGCRSGRYHSVKGVTGMGHGVRERKKVTLKTVQPAVLVLHDVEVSNDCPHTPQHIIRPSASRVLFCGPWHGSGGGHDGRHIKSLWETTLRRQGHGNLSCNAMPHALQPIAIHHWHKAHVETGVHSSNSKNRTQTGRWSRWC